MKIRVFADADELARATATLLTVRAARAIVEHNQANLVLSGGPVAESVLSALAAEPLKDVAPWRSCHFFWAGEACLPFDDRGSACGQARRLLFDHVPVGPEQLHPAPVDLYEPEEAAARYMAELRTYFWGGKPEFDLTLLALGADGGVAGLSPGTPAVAERRDWVTWSVPPEGEPGPARVSFTLPTLNRTRTMLLLASGAEMADTVARVVAQARAGGDTLPAAALRPWGEMFWFIDAAAAAGLESLDRKSTRLNSSHNPASRMPSSA
jgi:6-phosphogluconolactonase